MFKIAICDDERHFRELIHRILEEYGSDGNGLSD